jgi:hypothetical protein
MKEIGFSSPRAQQRSMTSWQRRSISALSRWTLAKSRSSWPEPLAIELAAPPPRPMSMAGPPRTMSWSPGLIAPFLHVVGADVTQTAGQHDGLVVAAEFGGGRAVEGGPYLGRGHLGLKGAEIAVDGRAAELVVESGAAERALDHDVECGDDAAGFAVVFFPRLDGAGQAEVGNGEADEAGLGL